MIKTKDLHITQAGLRLAIDDLDRMVDFVQSGGRFNIQSLREFDSERSSLIAINEFEDGRLFIRDGLHRASVIDFARRERVLYNDEFVMEHYTYALYMEHNIKEGFYTPFDPRTEVRLPDFFDFKEEVLKRVESSDDPEGFIERNKNMYACARGPEHESLETFSDLVSRAWI